MDAEIELMVENCVSSTVLPSTLLYPWGWPAQVWQRVHIDFAQKYGNYFLGLIDSHSKWAEVVHMRLATVQNSIDQMRLWFVAYGLPKEVVSDNGPNSFCRNSRSSLRWLNSQEDLFLENQT